MRICLDARMMGSIATRGIGRYVEELVRAMLAQSSAHRLILLVRDPASSPFIHDRRVEHVQADIPWYGFEEQFRLPRLVGRIHPDLFHVPHWNVPVAYGCPFAVTIHDLLLRHQPLSVKASTRGPVTRAIKRLGYRFALGHAIKRARAILVPTQFVADDIRHFYPPAANKICVTGEGITSFPQPAPSHFLSPTSYLLYVGSAYPHKRLDLFLDAWKVVSASRPDLLLVIAGEEDVFLSRQMGRVKREGLPRVIFTGRVTDAELAELYQDARLFVFPSSYEGFGLPPLEALSFGIPVVSSDAACLPEVLPKPGVRFFRNGDRNDMIRTLEATLDTLGQVKEEAQKGRSDIRHRHSWTDAARHTLRAYEQSL